MFKNVKNSSKEFNICYFADPQGTQTGDKQLIWRCLTMWVTTFQKSILESILRVLSKVWRMTTFQTFEITAGKRSNRVSKASNAITVIDHSITRQF